MPRIKRLVVPDHPHHVTQRGNRRQPTFFDDSDYLDYLALIAAAKDRADVEILAYCLMPNHVHFVVVPHQLDSLAKLFSEAHRRYTRSINRRYDWKGHLWQERFRSFVMDEPHLEMAVRYIELNPVRAGLCEDPAAWPWSSARAHLCGKDDCVVTVKPMLQRWPNWKSYLGKSEGNELAESLHKHSSTGRPAGDDKFVARLELLTGKPLCKRAAGRKKQSDREPTNR